MKKVHLAGNFVIFGNRVIQRCLICGVKLVDSLNQAVAQDRDDNSDNGVPVWEIGGLIEVDGGRTTIIGLSEEPKFDGVWENCCLETLTSVMKDDIDIEFDKISDDIKFLISHKWELVISEEEGGETWAYPQELRRNWPIWCIKAHGTRHYWDRSEAVALQKLVLSAIAISN